MTAISYHKAPSPEGALFSIIVPSWNNLPFLRLCIESLQQHSTHPQQIIVHVNEGTDGTIEYLQQAGIAYTHSIENVGICHGVNAAAELADTDYIMYFNDDMYALPGWDDAVYQHIKTIGHEQFYLSATLIEPEYSGNDCVIAAHDFGRKPDNFQSAALLASYGTLHKDDWSGATWPPSVMHRKLWEKVGGFSIEFSPGMYSDPDLSMKLWQAGVRVFMGVGAAKVYHFMKSSTGRHKKLNDGKRQFLLKWGISASTFHRFYLRRGQAYTGALAEPDNSISFFLARFKDFVKRLVLR
jgi:GT2 family glycosyltransferase